jgi:hypothetical protein
VWTDAAARIVGESFGLILKHIYDKKELSKEALLYLKDILIAKISL